MNDLYNERLDAMKARERDIDFVWQVGPPLMSGTLDERVYIMWHVRAGAQKASNTTRLAAYKRKRVDNDHKVFVENLRMDYNRHD